MIDNKQPTSHPLKWEYLKEQIEGSGLDNPDIWIEDLIPVGRCSIGGKEIEAVPVCTWASGRVENYGVEASFATVIDKKNNRIIICHHY